MRGCAKKLVCRVDYFMINKYYFKKYPGEASGNEEKGNSLISYFKSIFSVVEEDYYEAKEDSTNDKIE